MVAVRDPRHEQKRLQFQWWNNVAPTVDAAAAAGVAPGNVDNPLVVAAFLT